MAEGTAPAPPAQQPPAARVTTPTASGSDVVSARLQQVMALLFPSNLAAKAALFALVVALVPLLPTSQAPRIWELPHLLLLGIIISYGVFGQKNADAEAVADDANKPVDGEASVEAYVSQIMQGSPLVFDDGDGDDGDGGGKGGGVQAWSSQYLPDDPLVVVADGSNGDGDDGEKPLHLPVRKLKPAAAGEDSATPALADDIFSDGIEEEEEFLAPSPKSGGYEYDGGVRERATIPSPSSVLDADLSLSPSSSPPLLPPPPPPPPPPPFVASGRRTLRKPKARSFNGLEDRSANERLGWHGFDGRQFRSKSAVQATRSGFAGGYDPVVPVDDDNYDDDVDADLLDDEAVAASESSFSSDMVTDGDDGREEDVFEEEEAVEEEDGSSCDEELFELASKPGPEVEEEDVEDEVDRKADEFIAKFREQIRMQRVEPPTRR